MARPRSKDEPAAAKPSRLRALTEEYLALAARLREGGGAARVKRMHEKGQLEPARAGRPACSIPGAPWLEIGLLVAYDRYDGQAPGAGVITGVGVVEGREVVVVANDATVKAGSWWPETITKILRAQEIAMRQRIPIVYLVDSAGREPAVPGAACSPGSTARRASSTTTRSCGATCACRRSAPSWAAASPAAPTCRR